MKLYIRNHPEEIPQPWWDRFEATLIPRYVGTAAMRKHIEDRRTKLDAYGAVLQWDSENGLPYLLFKDTKKLSFFVLKWT